MPMWAAWLVSVTGWWVVLGVLFIHALVSGNSSTVFGLSLLGAVLAMIATPVIAIRRSRRWWVWAIAGVAFNLAAFTVLLVSEAPRFPCPHCREPVRDGATVCPHCQTPLVDTGP